MASISLSLSCTAEEGTRKEGGRGGEGRGGGGEGEVRGRGEGRGRGGGGEKGEGLSLKHLVAGTQFSSHQVLTRSRILLLAASAASEITASASDGVMASKHTEQQNHPPDPPLPLLTFCRLVVR